MPALLLLKKLFCHYCGVKFHRDKAKRTFAALKNQAVRRRPDT